MRLDIITLFPAMFAPVTDYGVTGRARQRGLLTVEYWNPRDYTHDHYRRVDDRPYGGGPGMVMLAQPLYEALKAARAADGRPAKVVYLSPQGRRLTQAGVADLAAAPRLILLAGRYEGVDERLLSACVDEEWSIGDYVLSGGELPAMVLIDAVTRLLPDVLGDAESAQQDSFVGGLLDCPHYTRPEVWQEVAVPSVLLSGDHAAIARWRLMQSLGRTQERRPDLLDGAALTAAHRQLLEEYFTDRRSTGVGQIEPCQLEP